MDKTSRLKAFNRNGGFSGCSGNPGMNEVDYLTSTSALELKEVPQRLAVIGSGYIARN